MRPFAVIGFTMLAVALFLCNLSIKATVIVTIAIIVAFSLLFFKKIRKNIHFILGLCAVLIFCFSLLLSQFEITKNMKYFNQLSNIEGVVCETPTHSAYANTYILKINKINGENVDLKLRYVTQENKNIVQGEKVKGKILITLSAENGDLFEKSLSDNVYGICFDNQGQYPIFSMGEKDWLRFNIGKIKTYFTNTVSNYMPNENGAIANAMTVGTRKEISDYTIKTFNYAGTTHLLVVSGLHMTIWTALIVSLFSKSKRLNKLSIPAGMLWILFYSLITGFTPSVVRAGIMAVIVLIAPLFSVKADSINSIGIAITVLLIANPFNAHSLSMWLSVASTLGIVILENRIENWLLEHERIGPHLKNFICEFVMTSILVSISAFAFTLPIFVLEFSMVSVVSIISNLVMVELAMLLMVSTLVGVAFHLLNLSLLAKGTFLITGCLSQFLKLFAEKIGMQKWSTICVEYDAFKMFLLVSLLLLAVSYVAYKLKKNILKPVVAIIVVSFVATTIFTTHYEKIHLSVDVLVVNDNLAIVLNYDNENLLVGNVSKNNVFMLNNALNSHNGKNFDKICLVDNIDDNSVDKSLIYNSFGKTEIQANVDKITFCDNVFVNVIDENTVEISQGNKLMLIINGDKLEIYLENNKEYDIIILYGQKFPNVENEAKKFLRDENSKVCVLEETDITTVYFK